MPVRPSISLSHGFSTLALSDDGLGHRGLRPCWSPTLTLLSASKPSNHQRMDSLEEQLRTLRN